MLKKIKIKLLQIYSLLQKLWYNEYRPLESIIYAEVSEWSNVRSWNGRIPKGIAGSNPVLCAI